MTSINPYNDIFTYDSMGRGLPPPNLSLVYEKCSITGIVSTHKDTKLFNIILEKSGYSHKYSQSQLNRTLFVTSDEAMFKKYGKEIEKLILEMSVGDARVIINTMSMDGVKTGKLLKKIKGGYLPLSNKARIYIKNVEGKTLFNYSNNTIENLFPLGNCNFRGGDYTKSRYAKVLHFNQPANNGVIHIVSDLFNLV